MSVVGGRAENMFSRRVFRLLSRMYGPAARCKGFSSSCRFAVLHQCIRPLIGAFAPGHHGYQRACDLISGQASIGPFGSPVCVRARKTEPPSADVEVSEYPNASHAFDNPLGAQPALMRPEFQS